ncbi:MAG: ATP-dependent DNA helicase RecG [Cytophagales bacterium]
MPALLNQSIEFLKSVGPQRAELLNKELNIHTYADLIQFFPFRHEDRSVIHELKECHEDMPFVQLKGKITGMRLLGNDLKKRLVIGFEDKTGYCELVWFQFISNIQKNLKIGEVYLVFGKPTIFNGNLQITHPELEKWDESIGFVPKPFMPVYHSTEKLKRFYLDTKGISKLVNLALEELKGQILENLPKSILEKYNLIGKEEALFKIHFPKNAEDLKQAKRRLKFEEFFYLQIKILTLKKESQTQLDGFLFPKATLFNHFFEKILPYQLTNAQKRVIKEVFKDCNSGKQMNRLVQGDVGSGKTLVAFSAMLFAIDNGFQTCLMAPTEILAEQHFKSLSPFAESLGISINLLTGSTPQSKRKTLLNSLETGELKMLIGTHALLEESVKFNVLGLCVVDEQHRFGVAQRARLWQKNEKTPPHVLVMTATPIPRTLAMTVYGDLDTSIIDELPPGRKPVETLLKRDADRLWIFDFMRQQLKLGRQIYVVYPLIEESEKTDLKDLMDGFESISRAFQDVPLSIVHGKQKPKDKEFEMQRFVRNETKIMVATTVIEVGVNVPNASVMVIENAERFGLSQLHQLRGRVGRGAEQSFCILVHKQKISKEAKERLNTMERTNNGFEIAEVDLRLRGPGDLMGTKQSGILDLMIANLSEDAPILAEARTNVIQLLENDPDLRMHENLCVKKHLENINKKNMNWARIS